MTALCDKIKTALSGFGVCSETFDGARIATHCLYPSHEFVHVYVVSEGGSYRVHDGGGAYKAAWTHGRDDRVIVRAIELAAAYYNLECVHDNILSPPVGEAWLKNAIVAVANASALAAARAAEKVSSVSEKELAFAIESALLGTFGQGAVAKEYQLIGRSGGARRFDFAIRYHGEFECFINAVTPFRASVNSKFVAFSDTEPDSRFKFAVYGDRLATSDVALLESVASLVPVGSLIGGVERALSYAN